ncbi:MAG: UDP-N-acetylmuramate--L-alanine ligase [Candidatus Omnitrophota bacterium]
MLLKNSRHIHFIGIGGIGMSGIARILQDRGFKVSGSDLKPNNLTDAIGAGGGSIFTGHRASNVPDDADMVVYSTCIKKDNPEMAKARGKKIPLLHRSDVLSELVNEKDGIAVSGAHGKTTTSALVSVLLEEAGFDPTVIVGGVMEYFGSNAKNGRGRLIVAEADESDATFTKLRPKYAILTNIDTEHLEYYGNMGRIKKASMDFMNNVRKDGCGIFCKDDPIISGMLKRCKSGFLTYGFSKDADLYAEDMRVKECEVSFRAIYKGRDLGVFAINIPGLHNAKNSLAAILLGLRLGIDADIIRRAMLLYKGAKRRFEIKALINGAMVVEDYAHHPTEIEATIRTCGGWPGRRLIGVFQPHRYTRTKFLKDKFAESLTGLDRLVLTDIYSASESPIKGVSSKSIYSRMVQSGYKNVSFLPKEKIAGYLCGIVREGDIVLVLGAGDIGDVSDELVERLKRRGSLQRASV